MRTYSDSIKFSGKVSLKKILLSCGILSSLLYVTTDLLISWQYIGYSLTDQVYSELLATGAPSRQIMLMSSIVYNLLVAAFAIGIWTSASPRTTAHITGAMMIGYSILSLVTPLFFQMDLRGAPVTLRGSLHPPMTAVMSLFILLSIGFGAFLSGKLFRIYSLFTILILLCFGAMTAAQAPLLNTGQPTPWLGLTERINIYFTMIWIVMLSVILIRRLSGQDLKSGNI